MGGLGFRASRGGFTGSFLTVSFVLGIALVMIAALFPGSPAAQPAGRQNPNCERLDGKFDVEKGWEDDVVAPGIEIVSASGQEVVFEVGLNFILLDLCVKTGNRPNYNVDTELPATGLVRITVSRAGTGPAIAHLSFDTEEVRFEDVCWNESSAGTTSGGSTQSQDTNLDPLATLGSIAGPAASEYQDVGSAPIMSDNVTYHGTIPLDSPGVGGEVVVREDLGGRKFFYVTGLKGLSIYDITIPAIPVLAGHLPFAHSQNEDLKVSDDGKTAVIAADGALAVPVNPVTTGITLIDVTNPALPQIVASSNDRVMGRGTAAGIAEHTAECANGDCSVIYGRTGRIYKVDRDLGRVDPIGVWNTGRGANTGSGTIHALNRDETGLVISDSNPRLILDPGVMDESATPENPRVLAAGARASQDNRLQHNNVRTDAASWVPRGEGQDPVGVFAGEDFQVDPRSISIRDQRTFLCPGELMIGNSESNLNPLCSAAGGLSTWSIQNFDRPGVTPIQQLEVFRPLNGTWADGSPAVNALGCSGHWFTENDGIVTASWYEHGIRFFDIDKRFGTIKEIGYFQPVATEAGAAYWVDDSFVYAVDYARGIDIVSFDRDAAAASQQELDQSWLAGLGRTGTGAAASRERYLCDLSARGQGR